MDDRVLITKVVSEADNPPHAEVLITLNNVEYIGGVWICRHRESDSNHQKGDVKLDKNGNPMMTGKIKLKEVRHTKPRNDPNPTFF